jgi:hypothetical protein
MSEPERGIMFLSKTPEPALSAAASKILKLRARIVPFGLPNPRCVPHAPSELLAQNEKIQFLARPRLSSTNRSVAGA